MLDLSSTHYQLSNAPSLVPVLKTVLHNFTKQLNQVWWYSLDPVVTSLQPQLSPNPDEKKFFWGQIWVLLTIGFPTRHRLSLYEQQNSQCLKTVFCGVYALPTSPRWRHSPSDFRVIHMQKNFFGVRFGMYSSVAFERAIAHLRTKNTHREVTKRCLLEDHRFPCHQLQTRKTTGLRPLQTTIGQNEDNKSSSAATTTEEGSLNAIELAFRFNF